MFLPFYIKVGQRLDKLKQVELQSRRTFDVLDFWIQWFNEVCYVKSLKLYEIVFLQIEKKIATAEKPAVVIYLKLRHKGCDFLRTLNSFANN